MKCNLLSILLLTISLVSCKYNREEGCNLEKMNIKGNVTKIETIVQSTMPLTELFYGSYDPSSAVSMLAGNFVLDFDNYGDLKKVTGYGVDGEQLFQSTSFSSDKELSASPSVIGVSAKQKIDRIETASSANENIVNARYYSGSELIWNQKVTYNKKGDIASIVKEYTSLSIKVGDFSIDYTDTTKYDYLSFDNEGNWTNATVEYKGVLPKHNHNFTVLRQITYDGESEKAPLMNQYNQLNAHKNPIVQIVNFDNVHIGSYGSINLPHYMALQSNDFISSVNNYNQGMPTIDYLFMSIYDNRDAYASFSVSRTYVGQENGFDDLTSEELSYSKELDEVLEEQNTQIMAQGGVYILKWLPYQFVNISGRITLKIRYYRYGNGNPIPVYCENYVTAMEDGYNLSIIFSYQSNLAERFRDDFEKSIKSINFD